MAYSIAVVFAPYLAINDIERLSLMHVDINLAAEQDTETWFASGAKCLREPFANCSLYPTLAQVRHAAKWDERLRNR